jgi:hypothetical protein
MMASKNLIPRTLRKHVPFVYDTVSISDCAASKGRMIGEQRIGKGFEGSGSGLIELRSWNSPERAEEDNEELRRIS